jgi:enoyl-CoA hydratase/3-hydroxyacyl-CoA dehydrogenase
VGDEHASTPTCRAHTAGAGARRGGLIKWADLVGAKHVAARLGAWAEQFKGAGLDGFFRPCEYLAKAAAEGTALSAGVPAAARM